MTPLLTIAIPTYNRRVNLERLLDSLLPLPQDVDGKVEIFVSDNASNDGTAAMVERVRRRHPTLRYDRNPTNIGADANITKCFEQARGENVWVFGDDDMPKAGVVLDVVEMLAQHHPALTYLPSEWVPEVFQNTQGVPRQTARYSICDRTDFARRTNIWLTFLSGIIVRKFEYDFMAARERLEGTCLIQMGWTLAALKQGDRFCVFDDQMVLATGGNSGGYNAVEVFGSNLPATIEAEFGLSSDVYRAILSALVRDYLPQLIWSIRCGAERGFERAIPWRDIRARLGRYWYFWVFLVPISAAPPKIAWLSYSTARLLSKLRRVLYR